MSCDGCGARRQQGGSAARWHVLAWARRNTLSRDRPKAHMCAQYPTASALAELYVREAPCVRLIAVNPHMFDQHSKGAACCMYW